MTGDTIRTNDDGGARLRLSDPQSTARQLDAIFGLLAVNRRRLILECLRGHHDGLPVSTLAQRVLTREASQDGGRTDEQAIADVHTSLVHVHLPKLVEVGIVEVDHRRRTVRLVDGATETAVCLELLDQTPLL